MRRSHQRVYALKGLTFSSNFDSGNLTSVEAVEKDVSSDLTFERFKLEFAEDNEGTGFSREGRPSRSWFHFSVSGAKRGRRIELVFYRSPRWRFFAKGYRAVSRTKKDGFQLVPVDVETVSEELEDIKVDDETEGTVQQYYVATIQYEFKSDDTVFFSTSFPYSLTEVYASISRYEKRIKDSTPSKLYYTRELLTRSLLGRRVELLTITNRDEEDKRCQVREPKLNHLFPSESLNDEEDLKHLKEYELKYERAMRGGFGLSQGQRPLLPSRPKPTILLTCRVHPGETPSQYLLDGAMKLLLDPEDPVANKLRDHFVFKIIPVLNPDGVVLGHNRLDVRGRNLNRCYSDPTPSGEPTVHAAKEIAKLAARTWNGHHDHHNTFDSKKNDGDDDEFNENKKTKKAHRIELRRLYDSNRAQIKNVSSLNRVLTRHFLVQRRALIRPSVAQTKFWMKSQGIEDNNSALEFRHVCSYFEHFVRPHLVNESVDTTCGLLAHIDFHAHANKTGIFMFGNHHVTEAQRVQNALYPWILSRNCNLFEFESCDFAAENMISMSEGKSRLGTGRVAIYQATNAINVYTLETHFQHSKCEHVRSELDQYTPKHWRQVGHFAMISFLDMCGIPYASRSERLPKSLSDCRSAVQLLLRRMESSVASSSSGKKKKTKKKKKQRSSSGNLCTRRRLSSGGGVSSSSGSFSYET